MSTLRLILAFLSVLPALPCLGQSADVGAAAPRPVRRFTSDSPPAALQFFSFEFQRPYLGREGPNLTRLDGDPSAGAQYLVSAKLSGQGAVATLKFELVDEDGRLIQVLRMSKYDNSLDGGEFVGSMKVPPRPFRVAVSGRRADGEPYRQTYRPLFRPAAGPPAPPLLPPGLPPAEAKKIADGLVAMEKQFIATLEERARRHPEGVIVVPRIEVSNVTYDTLVSAKGNRLGMRLSYDIRFSEGGDYAHSLEVFPVYEDVDSRGLVRMEVLKEEITPRPGPPSYATPQIHIDLDTLVKYGSAAWFEGGLTYHFTVELVPNFVGQNADKTKFCVNEEQYKHRVKSGPAWEAMKASAAPVKYHVFMSEVGFGGETGPFHPPGSFYEGFLREGAVECTPYKNIYF